MGASDDMTSRENQIASDSQSAVYMVYILAISVLSLVFLAAGVILDGNSDVASILNVADTALCALFFIDFVITLTRSKSKRQYLATWGWLDLVSSLPMVPALRIGRLARVVRVVRVLRGIRSVRVLSSFFLERRAQNTVVAAVLVTILLMVFGSIAILSFETGPDANIKGPEDALWWSAVTLTTVGYGDRFPVTTEGGEMQIEFTGAPGDAMPVKDFLVPQLNAARERDVQATFILTFSPGLHLAGDAAEKLGERLAKFASGAAYVSATAEATA